MLLAGRTGHFLQLLNHYRQNSEFRSFLNTEGATN
jgi:hypothetical protein